MSSLSTVRTVMITGANGYLASHIVQQLLQRDITVHACVRDAMNESSVQHLLRLSSAANRLKLFSTGDLGDASLKGRYDAPLKGCDAVIHAATPLAPKLSGKEFDGERDMLRPGMSGTSELLESLLKCETRSSIQCLVLTSSMSAAAPSPEPAIKDESHWSDDAAQLAKGNYYGCLKTRQEKLCTEWVQTQREAGTMADNFRFVAICPTMIIGSPVGANQEGFSYTPSGTMGALFRWLTGGRSNAPNDSMSFIDVQDCAAMHVAAIENTNASGRYFALVESWHWNDILTTLKELYPGIPPFVLCEEELITPSRFHLDRMRSLGVEVKDIRSILKDSVSFLRDAGALK